MCVGSRSVIKRHGGHEIEIRGCALKAPRQMILPDRGAPTGRCVVVAADRQRGIAGVGPIMRNDRDPIAHPAFALVLLEEIDAVAAAVEADWLSLILSHFEGDHRLSRIVFYLLADFGERNNDPALAVMQRPLGIHRVNQQLAGRGRHADEISFMNDFALNGGLVDRISQENAVMDLRVAVVGDAEAERARRCGGRFNFCPSDLNDDAVIRFLNIGLGAGKAGNRRWKNQQDDTPTLEASTQTSDYIRPRTGVKPHRSERSV